MEEEFSCKEEEYQESSSTEQDKINEIFGELQNEWIEFKKKSATTKSMICANAIGNKELYFKCFDCSGDFPDHCYCQSCFFYEDHIGHRTSYYNNLSGGVCDCGDLNLNVPIFCRVHTKQGVNNINDEYMSLIPINIMSRVKCYFIQQLKSFFELCEKQLQPKQDEAPSNEQISKQIVKLLTELSWLSDQSPIITKYLGNLLCQQTLENFITIHDCLQNTDELPAQDCKIMITNQDHPCQCPIIGMLFKYIQFYPEMAGLILESLAIKLFIDEQFKSIIAQQYCVNYSYIFRFTLDKEYNAKSLLYIYYQFFSKKFMKELITQKNVQKELKNSYQKAWDCIRDEIYQKKQNIYLENLVNFIHFVSKQSELSELWILDFNLFLDFFQGIIKYKIEYIKESIDYFYYIHYQSTFLQHCCLIFKNLMEFQQLHQFFPSIFKIIYNNLNEQVQQQKVNKLKEEEKKRQVLNQESQAAGVTQPTDSINQQQQQEQQNDDDLNQILQEQIQVLEEEENPPSIQVLLGLLKSKEKKNIWPISNNDIRAFTLSLLTMLIHHKFSVSDVRNFIILNNQISVEQFNEILLYIVDRIKATILFVLAQQQIILQQKKRDYEVEQQWKIVQTYSYSQKYLLYDYDFGSLQICLMFLPSNLFFSQLLSGSPDQISHFIHIIPQILLQGVYLINIANQLTDINKFPNMAECIKDTLANVFFGFSQLDINVLKTHCQEFGLAEKLEIQKALFWVAEMNENQKYKLKQQYQNLYDPYLNMKSPQVYSTFYEKLKSSAKLSNTSELDIVLGNILTVQTAIAESQKNPEDQSFLNQLSKNVAQDHQFLTVIMNLIVDAQPNKDAMKIIQIVLLKNIKDEKLMDFLDQYTPNLQEKLKNVDLKEQEVIFCLNRLLQMIMEVRLFQKKLQNQDNQMEKFDSKAQLQTGQQNVDDKKKMALERQKKIMEQYQQKQNQIKKQFDQNNQQIQNIEQEVQDSIQQCIVCRNSVDDLNVVLCYLSSDNSTGQIRKILLSCGHLQHYQCSQSKEYKIKILGKNEIYCPQCKFVSNTCLIYLDSYVVQQINSISNQNQSLSEFHASLRLNKCQQATGDLIIKNCKQLIQSFRPENMLQDLFQISSQLIASISDAGIAPDPSLEVKSEPDLIKDQQHKDSDKIADEELKNKEQPPNLFKKLKNNLFYFQSMLAQESQNQDNSDNDWVFKILKQALQFSMENAIVLGMQEFLKADYLICRNGYLTYLLFVTQMYVPSDFFLKNALNEMEESIKQLYNINAYIKEQIFNNNQQQQQSRSLNIYKILINFTSNFMLVCLNSDKQGQQSINTIYLAFLQLFFTQLQNYFIILQGRQDGEQNFTVQKVSNNLENKNILSYIQSCLLPYIRLSVCLYISIFKQESTLLEKLSTKKFNLDEEEINFYTSFVLTPQVLQYNEDFAFSEFQQSITDLEKSFSLDQINQLLHSSNLYWRKALIPLAPTYREMHNKYFFRPCQLLCQNYPKKFNSDLYVCLLCDKTMCNLMCKYPEILGNLSFHAKTEHCGQSIYYQVLNGIFGIVHNNFTMFQPTVYQDQFGQPFKMVSKVNFADYVLNNKVWNKIIDMYNKRQIPQYVRYLILNGFKNHGESM